MIRILDRSKCHPQLPSSPHDQGATAAFHCSVHDDTGYRCDYFNKFELESLSLDKPRVEVLRGGSVIAADSCNLQV